MNYITYKTGVHPNTRCATCGRSPKQSFSLGPVDTGINHPEYCITYSFRTREDGRKDCPRCWREADLKSLFDLMDKRDAQRKAMVQN